MTANSNTRAALFSRAAALCGGVEPEGARSNAYRRRLILEMRGAGLGLDDIRTAPAWLSSSPKSQKRFLQVCGAVALGPHWRQSLDGATLRQARAILGDRGLEDLFENPDLDWPQIEHPARAGKLADVEHLGAQLVLAYLETRPRLTPFLTAPVDTQPDDHGVPLERAVGLATALWGEGAPA